MCGIVALVGSQEATPLLLEGGRQLDYRVYDSAGIGHTRWATHGKPGGGGAERNHREGPHPTLASEVNVAFEKAVDQ